MIGALLVLAACGRGAPAGGASTSARTDTEPVRAGARCAPLAARRQDPGGTPAPARPTIPRENKASTAPVGRILGTIDGTLRARPLPAEATLGGFVARAFLAAAERAGSRAKIALVPLGTLHAPELAGAVSEPDVRAALADEPLVEVTLRGTRLFDAVAHGLTVGKPLQLAGLRVTYCPLLAAADRLRRLGLGRRGPGARLDFAARYRVIVAESTARAPAALGLGAPLSGAPIVRAGRAVTTRMAVREALARTPKIPSAPHDVYWIVAPRLPGPPAVDPSLGTFVVRDVHDGDTMRVIGLKKSLRFKGVDTEELYRTGNGRTADEWRAQAETDFAAYAKLKRGSALRPVKYGTPMGEAARDFLQTQVKPGDLVRLEVDELDRPQDGFGRWLVHVFALPGAANNAKRGAGAAADSAAKPEHLNLALVRRGYSPYFVKYGEMHRHHADFVRAEAEARRARRGIWAPPGARGTAAHYPDYAERTAWWARRARAIKTFAALPAGKLPAVRTGYPAGVPVLAANLGKRLRAFGPVVALDAEAHTLGLAASMRASFTVALPEALFARLGAAKLAGEYVLATGTLVRVAKGYRLEVAAAQDFRVFDQ